ncbi:MAG TPA: hypothetical protein VG713_07270 [Pirellulales bacterium]|nr:hypothetical protein [Pirellulales bacterium]
MTVHIHAVGRPEVPPLAMSDRFRHEIAYFMSVAGPDSATPLSAGEYRIRRDDANRWLDDGVFYLVSPLDSEKKTEIELREEHEAFLEWLLRYGVEHVRIQ